MHGRNLGQKLALLVFFVGSVSFGASRFIENLDSGTNQTLVTYGTSITATGDRWSDQYNDWLGSNYTGLVTYHNTAVGGQASDDGVANFNSAVLVHDPDTVFLEFAINDAYLAYTITVSEARANLNNMLGQLDGIDAEPVLLIPNEPIDSKLALRTNVLAYYEMYREVAAENDIILVDTYDQWHSLLTTNAALFDTYVPDGIHPTSAGAAAMYVPDVIDTMNTFTYTTNPPARALVLSSVIYPYWFVLPPPEPPPPPVYDYSIAVDTGSGGNGYDGTCSTTTILENVSGNWQANLNGSTEYISTSQSGVIGTEGSISVWITPTTISGLHEIISVRSGENLYILRTDGNKIKFTDGGGVRVTSSASISASTEYHLVITVDDIGATANYKLYINNVLDTSTTATYNPATGAGLYVLGKLYSASSLFFSGIIDDLVVYESILSVGDVDDLYNGIYPAVTEKIKWTMLPEEL